jgi:hypothetical protein
MATYGIFYAFSMLLLPQVALATIVIRINENAIKSIHN